MPGAAFVPSSYPTFSSSGLSLAIERAEMENNHQLPAGNGHRMAGNFDTREENDSRSGSGGDLDAASGDDQDAADNRRRKKRTYRHTPQQIQELESLFKENPHPDEKQRMELSKRLCLEPRQVKFWFQNRRTQLKMQLERHENSLLRQENDKLRSDNMTIRDAMTNPICSNCGGPAVIGDISLEEQQLRIDNARLKDELDRIRALATKFLGRPISSMRTSISDAGLQLAVGTAGYGGLNPSLQDFSGHMALVPPNGIVDGSTSLSAADRSMLVDLALAAMAELVKLAQAEEPLWIKGLEGGRDLLNEDEYMRSFSPCIGPRPNGFVSEASRETAIVIIDSLTLMESLMDSNRWSEMFPCLVSRSCTTHVICGGVGGTRNGALQLMEAEVEVVSPLVPVREMRFLRLCKQHADGVWAVVDVSVDSIGRETNNSGDVISCRRLPSGCLVQDMPNGYSKVTWVEHTEYEERQIHPLYRRMMREGIGMGAPRWVAVLQRHCDWLAVLMLPDHAQAAAAATTPGGRRSMLKLAQRMTGNFCAAVCASKVHRWSRQLSGGSEEDGIRLMSRKSVDDPGEPSGVVLSAATSVWLQQVPPQRLFDFLRDERLRSNWDILSNGGPMEEMARIPKGPPQHDDHQPNCVSLLRPTTAVNATQSGMLVLQETCTDATGSLVVYAPVDIPAMHVVMNGGDPAYVALLPSGFAIAPDGGDGGDGGGSLLTVAFQILVNSLPSSSSKLNVESVETVNTLISCTVQKIKVALNPQTR